MPKYRTLEPIAFVEDGKVRSVAKDRTVELTEETAKSLAGAILNVDNKTRSMFPNGSPVFNQHFARSLPNQRVAGEHVEAAPAEPKAVKPEPARPEPVKPQPQQPKQESK
jgi:hypothetical protein